VSVGISNTTGAAVSDLVNSSRTHCAASLIKTHSVNATLRTLETTVCRWRMLGRSSRVAKNAVQAPDLPRKAS